MQFLFLTPPPAEAPRSSLVHMFETARNRWAEGRSVYAGFVMEGGGWAVNHDMAFAHLRDSMRTGCPLAILGTAFSCVQLLDELAANNQALNLPPGSRVLETGGYKNRSRSLPKPELHGLISSWLGVDSSHIVSEYGMSELSSQAYDSCIGGLQPGQRVFHFPPWARAMIVSPETGLEARDGETGLLRVLDLANTFSAMAIQTSDLGIRRGVGFELVGRAEAAEARGCSLMAV